MTLECVVNLSEGRSDSVLGRLADAAGPCLLDRHTDPHHHRSVFTLGGPAAEIEAAARALAVAAVSELDLSHHSGVHPRIGVLDVVPFVPLDGTSMADAILLRDGFARWAGAELGLPCFLYGPERTLPDIRTAAFRTLWPDTGPRDPHPRAGATAVGARPVLVAFNLWLADGTPVDVARRCAAGLRSPLVRALGLDVGGRAQISMNLLDPARFGPAQVWDAAQTMAPLADAELVGLVPTAVLEATPPQRWTQLDLSAERTIEARLAARRKARF
ncbi:MAG: glutamate formimidoyltransferase [Acidimicrobiales bacterium]